MPSGDQSGWISKINLAMAGVEAGILGGLFMMLWLAILSLLGGQGASGHGLLGGHDHLEPVGGIARCQFGDGLRGPCAEAPVRPRLSR